MPAKRVPPKGSKGSKGPARAGGRRSYTAAALGRDADLRRSVERDLERGFKWIKGSVTDGNTTPNFDVSVSDDGGVVSVSYRSRKGLFNPWGSVFSRSVAPLSRIEYNGPVGEYWPFVRVAGRNAVKHYGWDGKLAARF